jgi:hypothetical protein
MDGDGMSKVTFELPVSPPELWMLWRPGSGDTSPGWVVAIDDPPGGENYLVCLSRKDAEAAALHQNEQYETCCVIVRVK